MIRRFTLSVVTVILCVLVAGSRLPSIGALSIDAVSVAEAQEALVSQAQTASCASLVTSDRAVRLIASGLTPAGALGQPELCLLYFPSEDVYHGVVRLVDGADQFRSAKAEAITRLIRAGIDVCRVISWQGIGRGPLALSADDQLNLPVECTPRVIAADPGANTWLASVQQSLTQTVATTAVQMGWRPIRPLTVIVYSDSDAAVAAYQKYLIGLLPGETPESLAQQVRDGVTWYAPNLDGIISNLLLLNLTRPHDQTRLRVGEEISFAYTDFASTGVGGASAASPQWFHQGLDSYQAERNAGATLGNLEVASALQREGRQFHLQDLSHLDDWLALWKSDPQGAQSRGYAAIAFLSEQYGFEGAVQLLRDNHDGTLSQFYDHLAALTGMDLAALDQALDNWLSSAVPAGGS